MIFQAFMEQVAQYNLIRQIRQVPEIRRIIRYSLALPLLPENLIVRGFRILMEYARGEGRFIFRIVRLYLMFIWRYWVSRHWRRARMCVFGSC